MVLIYINKQPRTRYLHLITVTLLSDYTLDGAYLQQQPYKQQTTKNEQDLHLLMPATTSSYSSLLISIPDLAEPQPASGNKYLYLFVYLCLCDNMLFVQLYYS